MWWDGVVEQSEMGRSLFYWWLNNLMGSIIMTPALLILWQLRRSGDHDRPLWQLFGTIVLSSVALVWLLLSTFKNEIQPMHFFSLAQIFLMSLTLIYGIRGAALGALVITALVQVYSFSGYGPFAAIGNLEERMLYINTFILGLTTTAGLVGALISEKNLHQKHLEQQAYTDPLTGLFNRRYFYEHASRKLSSVQRSGCKVGLLWLDVDHFKKINDTYGHPAGDAVLQKLASLLQSHFRMQDLKARMGGEEFAVLLSDCEDLPRAAEKLLELIRSSDEDGDRLPKFRISIGASMMHTGDLTGDDVMRRADLALYQAKEGGRDRAVVVG
jgi:diguanylate cyclase (GGDEF)-like protein